MIPHTFGETAPFSLGVEEELQILDPETFDQVPGVAALVAQTRSLELSGAIKTELFASMVELATPVCADAAEAEERLVDLRVAAAAAAGRAGLTLAAAGTHPFARPELQEIVAEERYKSFVAYGGATVLRQNVQGLHVHVAMASPDDCWRCLEAILPWLPVVLAISANSPWLAGQRTGTASNRALVLAELPRAGGPPAFASYAEWERWLERLIAFDVVADHTRLWWDVRPHPRLGSLEVRIADQPTSVAGSASLAALVQALCAAGLRNELPERRAVLGDRGRGDYAQNRWAAARFGPRAELLHPSGVSACSAAELGAELLELVSPAAASLGGARVLQRLDPAQCEGDRQLVWENAHEAAADLVLRSVA